MCISSFFDAFLSLYIPFALDKGYCMRGDMCPYDHGVDAVIVEDPPMLSGFPSKHFGPSKQTTLPGK